MKIAYADPPYIGQAKKHYDCPEVDHLELVQRLCTNFDTWALSCSSPSLVAILPICPTRARVAAWVKPFSIFKPGVNPSYSWEPVIFYGVKKRPRSVPTTGGPLPAAGVSASPLAVCKTCGRPECNKRYYYSKDPCRDWQPQAQDDEE